MECLACHAPNNDGARFCAKCGAPLPQSEAAEDPLLGKMVGGRYRIIGILGEGGMGRVYNAEQQMGTSVRKVAVKTLLAQFAKDPQTVARFMREVGTVSELEHPNTIKVYDFGQTDTGELYIAMELLQGQSLDDVLSSGQPLSPERVDRIIGQVCGSLQEAHDKGIVHRDLKPANIFLTTRAGEEDVVKVLDFGIAKKADSKDSKQEQKLTQQGTILGTPPYMSPEQFTGKELDARSDIYSLGVVTYEMLTGRLPFEADTPWQWMTAHMTAQPYPFETLPAAANVPPKMRQAVLRALAKEKEQRPQTSRDFFEDLTLGTQRMSVLGLAAGGAVPSSGGTGTAMLQMGAPAGAARGGQTQIGEPIFPDGAPPGGAGRTMAGETMPQAPYVAAGAMAAAPAPMAAAPNPRPASGGPNLLVLGLVGFLVIGGGVGGFFAWKRSQGGDDDGSTTIQVPKGKPTGDTDVSGDDDDGSSSSGAAEGGTTSSSSGGDAPPIDPTSTTPTSRPTTTTAPTTKPTTTAAPQPGIDACCANKRLTKQQRSICASYNSGIKSGRMDRKAAIAQLSAQGVKCQ